MQQPHYPMFTPPQPARRPRRWIYAAALLLVCWMLGLTSSPAGLLAIGLMVAVVYQISRSVDRRAALVLSALVGITTALIMGHARITPKVDVPDRPVNVSIEELRQEAGNFWQGIFTRQEGGR